MIGFVYDDGGRRAAGYKGRSGDCVTRAIAIAAVLPYQTVYDAINATAQRERPRKGNVRSSAREGVHKGTSKRYLASLGATWTPTMGIGTGCTTHLREDELPMGRLVVSLSGHYAAVINGVLRDTSDCSREGTRCVYGYWTMPDVGQEDG